MRRRDLAAELLFLLLALGLVGWALWAGAHAVQPGFVPIPTLTP